MDSRERKAFFTRIYRRNLWKGDHSRSGPGSEGAFGEAKASIVRQVIRDLDIRSILDLGCGDFSWMQGPAVLVDRYLGVDIVNEVVDGCSRQYGSKTVSFQQMDIARDDTWTNWPDGTFDLAISFDLFGHLLNPEVDTLLRHLCTGEVAHFLLVTNRRDQASAHYLQAPKSRSQGIDIHLHPTIQEGHIQRLLSVEAPWPQDYFEVYRFQ